MNMQERKIDIQQEERQIYEYAVFNGKTILYKYLQQS